MQIPVLNGIYTDEASDFRTAYPINMVPVPKSQGISQGYLRPADGIVKIGTGPGTSRGGINWEGQCYRVMGTKFVHESKDGVFTIIGDVGINTSGSTQVSMDYSFDNLGVVSNQDFFLYNGTTFSNVADPDLGNVIDVIWVDGYFMLTDGEFIILTELSDPFSILPTKYGSSEADPDPINALLKLRNEAHALNRYTIEIFDNVGGSGFPFQRIDGAQIQRGVIGTHACCVFSEVIAFVGSGRNESIAVWIAADGNSIKISTREVDQVLATYTEDQLKNITVQPRIDKGHRHLYINLPNQTLVYDWAASESVGQPVWFILSSTSTLGSSAQYRAKDIVWCYDRWLVADPQTFDTGYFTTTLSSHWGSVVSWAFTTTIIYNEGRGAIIHDLELVCLSGRSELGDDSTVWTSYSVDGETYSLRKGIKAGKQGQRTKRLMWLNQGAMRQWRTQRFEGTSDAMLAVARLEARMEPLTV